MQCQVTAHMRFCLPHLSGVPGCVNRCVPTMCWLSQGRTPLCSFQLRCPCDACAGKMQGSRGELACAGFLLRRGLLGLGTLGRWLPFWALPLDLAWSWIFPEAWCRPLQPHPSLPRALKQWCMSYTDAFQGAFSPCVMACWPVTKGKPLAASCVNASQVPPASTGHRASAAPRCQTATFPFSSAVRGLLG